VWALVPDKYESAGPREGASAFLTALIAFFIAEMGDKTQLATVALGARYEVLWAVVAGTTLGMMIANVPAVLIGEQLASRIRLDVARKVAAGLFFVTALLALFGTG
jgi:Ca2+/H+ antiporter, TMEM165/GDT1 family